MATGYSETDIANQALTLVGASRITSLDDDASEEAIVCRVQYPIARDAVIGMAPWTPFMTRARLSADATAPEWGFAYRYELPSDCIQPTRDIYTGAIRLIHGDYVIEGNYLLTDRTGPIDIRYIRRVTNPGDWDHMFVHVVSLYLAVLISTKLAQDPAKRSSLRRQFEEVASTAKAQNARRNAGANLELVDSWEHARYAGNLPSSYSPRLGGWIS